MKKLQKLTLASSEAYFNLQAASILSQEEQKDIYAGDGPSPNECYFDGLAYLSNYYAPSETGHDAGYFYNGYYNVYGTSGFYYDSNGTPLGVQASDTSYFTNQYFTTTGLQTGADVNSFLTGASTNRVFTSINITTSSGVILTHAVIIDSQEPNGLYSGHDATTGDQIDIDPSQINTAMLIGVSGASDPL